MYLIFKRIIDFTLSLVGILFLFPLMLIVGFAIIVQDGGAPIYWSKRVGRNNTIFLMPKFRTMKLNTPQLATHLIKGEDFITPLGKFLRKASFDELPQLWSILKGDMAIVGPRPALFNQYDLIEMRTKKSIHLLSPGLTGWAQINGRDEIPLEKKVELDWEYSQKKSLMLDLKIVLLTLFKAMRSEGISH